MKKLSIILSLVMLLSLFLVATTVVYGSTSSSRDDALSGDVPAVKPTKKVNDHTPGPPPDKGNKDKGKKINLKGEIVSADTTSIIITLEDTSTVTVLITEDTRINVATRGKDAGVADLLPGLQVGIQATEKEGVLTAKSIRVIHGKPVHSHNVGVVTDYQPGVNISIAARDGVTYTFLLTPDVKILPEERLSLLVVGAYVTVISPRDLTSTDLTATGIVIHPAVPEGQKITPQTTVSPEPEA